MKQLRIISKIDTSIHNNYKNHHQNKIKKPSDQQEIKSMIFQVSKNKQHMEPISKNSVQQIHKQLSLLLKGKHLKVQNSEQQEYKLFKWIHYYHLSTNIVNCRLDLDHPLHLFIDLHLVKSPKKICKIGKFLHVYQIGKTRVVILSQFI